MQHLAFKSEDIFRTVAALKANGFQPLVRSPNYSEDIEVRFGLEPELLERLRADNILYDRDSEGEYFQIYSPNYGDCFFFEIVEPDGMGVMARLTRRSGLPRRNGTFTAETGSRSEKGRVPTRDRSSRRRRQRAGCGRTAGSRSSPPHIPAGHRRGSSPCRRRAPYLTRVTERYQHQRGLEGSGSTRRLIKYPTRATSISERPPCRPALGPPISRPRRRGPVPAKHCRADKPKADPLSLPA